MFINFNMFNKKKFCDINGFEWYNSYIDLGIFYIMKLMNCKLLIIGVDYCEVLFVI